MKEVREAFQIYVQRLRGRSVYGFLKNSKEANVTRVE